ncbi:MAG: nuclear transport factor 2 family protein [Candidatus Binatia bacterium]|nr:nuclear transport factor 2 family protein [Candidatus Binatia bacterium]
MEDLGSLRAAFRHLVDAFNAKNLDALVASVHDDVVQIGAFSPVPVDGKSALREVYEAFFHESESATFTPINPHFRLNGSTGVSWGHFALALQLKGGPVQIPAGCFTIIFTQVGTQWLVCASHFSWLPQGM